MNISQNHLPFSHKATLSHVIIPTNRNPNGIIIFPTLEANNIIDH